MTDLASTPVPAKPAMPAAADPCPCGSETSLGGCCGPVLDGTAAPPTAEALMRSRYTAFVLGRPDWLEESLAPEARGDFSREEAEKWHRDSQWLGLEIRSTEAGGPDDETGQVEFVASYRMDGKLFRHHETSRFVRRDGRWRYLDGTMGAPARHAAAKPYAGTGRNDPCPCGSGKKYKKCHGA